MTSRIPFFTLPALRVGTDVPDRLVSFELAL